MAARNESKELREPDWLHTTVDRFLKAVQTHRTEITIGIAAFVLLVGCIGAIVTYTDRKERKALAELELIEPDFQAYLDDRNNQQGEADSKKSEELVGRLEAFISKRDGTDAAALANYYLGELYFAEKRFGKAVSAYKEYLDDLPKRNAFRAFVLSDLAYAYQAENKDQEAAEAFLEAAEIVTNPLRDQDYVNAARSFEKGGNVEKAKKYYKKVIEEFPESSLLLIAKTKLNALGENPS